MRVFLVDDEPPVRGMLRLLLQKIEGVEVVGEEGNPVLAISEINRLAPDLLFLDIDMPLLNGFELLPYLTCEPMVVFCTAYYQFALKAFEVSALDYMLKPPTLPRIQESLAKAYKWERVQQLEKEQVLPQGLAKLVCSVGSKFVTVWTSDVLYLNKDDRYTLVTTAEGKELLTRLSIGYLSEHLDPRLFLQINRGLIINKSAVGSYKRLDSGNFEVTTTDGASYTLSRRRAKAFKEWLSE